LVCNAREDGNCVRCALLLWRPQTCRCDVCDSEAHAPRTWPPGVLQMMLLFCMKSFVPTESPQHHLVFGRGMPTVARTVQLVTGAMWWLIPQTRFDHFPGADPCGRPALRAAVASSPTIQCTPGPPHNTRHYLSVRTQVNSTFSPLSTAHSALQKTSDTTASQAGAK
jgi:hypothetical protein